MSSLVDLNPLIHQNRSAALVHALLANSNQSGLIRPISSSAYTTNWSISHIPGPPTFYLTSPLFTSTILSIPTTTIAAEHEDRYYPFWILVIIAIFGCVTSVLTVLGNILVILAFFLDRQIRQPTNYFILSLSVSDFLIGLLSMPILTIYIYAKEWPLNAIICDIWLSLDYTVCLTSIYTVLFITIDRFCSVKMPAKYRKWRTGRKINIMIAITWAGKDSHNLNPSFDSLIYSPSSCSDLFYCHNALSSITRREKHATWSLYVFNSREEIKVDFLFFLR